MSPVYTSLALLITITAAFSYINCKYIHLPSTIGIMIMSLVCSMVLIALGNLFPELAEQARVIMQNVRFGDLIMQSLLSFLLFAGAIQLDVRKLHRHRSVVILLATIGVIISAAVIGAGIFFLFQVFNIHVPLIYCLMFGALISPTDPIAVLGILGELGVPESLEIKIAGESMFNDGVGVVLFLILLQLDQNGVETMKAGQIAWIFLREAAGGWLWGLALGYGGVIVLKSINNYKVETLITLAIVMGGYLVSELLDVSGALSMVVAGIIIGNKGMAISMSKTTRDYVSKFWELIDEIMNAFLFLLIGFEMLVLVLDWQLVGAALLCLPVVFLARWVSVIIPMYILTNKTTREKGAIAVLTWGGLRGAVSVALALSLPEGPGREKMVTITYVVVLFSIIVQGLSIGPLARRWMQPVTIDPSLPSGN
ncbi:sodium:proton antiporter [uncultured Chitinophaga sp.]|uniref:cation:proton antiporter n=1 Tax=uncultured Chitinophaga sp. TaxID=339340 RepID=UPI0025D5E825|nr:sodium:proton antiporter [uncultured Chitinophaga sp.]